MRIIFDVGHPAHVHLYKNAIKELMNKGNQVKIVARDREITCYLLEKYGFQYTKFPHGSKLMLKPFSVLRGIKKLLKIARKFSPDLLVSNGSIQSAQVSAIIDKPHICFGDTDVKMYSVFYFTSYLPFALYTNSICSPNAEYMDPDPKRSINYKGYHELAYLHPNRFKPNPSVLEIANLSKNDRYIIVRFASWDAVHDIGQKVFNSIEERIELIKSLEEFGKIFITSEIPLPKSLEKYRVLIPPEKIHSFLYYSSLYIGEGATLASEAGVLGVPWIWLCGKERLGYLNDQEENYGLGYSINNNEEALKKVQEIFRNYSDVKKKWQKRRKKLLSEKIDTTSFMLWFLTNYPKSHEIMKKNPNYDKKFK